MSKCHEAGCPFAIHEQFKGYRGMWNCHHPYRNEIDNGNPGDFTYPCNHKPNILVCYTPKEDHNQPEKHQEALAQAQTPGWCYLAVVERSKIEQPGFDPDVQRSILWPEKIQGLDKR